MRAHLLQLDPVWEDPPASLERAAALASRVDTAPGDLILLPEMFDTGFSLHTPVTADRGRTLAFLSTLARERGVYVQGGRTLLREDERLAHNHMTTVRPDGSVACDYAKVHPFTFGRETERFAPGRRVEVWAWTDATVCPAICYDLRFPELFRAGVLRGAEIFAIGACWPDARHAHWRALAIARAIENQAFVLAVNRCGSDPHLRYAGGSIGVDPMGVVLGELGDTPDVLSVEIDLAGLRAWRRTFPAVRDIRITDLRRGDVGG